MNPNPPQMTETCTVEVLANAGLVRHGLSVELMLMGSRDLAMVEHEYAMFKLLEERHPTSAYFLKPVRCDAEGAFYRAYNPETLIQHRALLLTNHAIAQAKIITKTNSQEKTINNTQGKTINNTQEKTINNTQEKTINNTQEKIEDKTETITLNSESTPNSENKMKNLLAV